MTYLLKEDKFLLILAMTRKPVSCAQITTPSNKEPFVYHAKLGAFHSDWHQHDKGQLMFAENGLLHLHIEDKKLFLPSWYCAWIPAGTSHQIWSNSAELYIKTIYLETHSSQHPLFGQAVVFPASNLLKEMIGYTEKWNTGNGDENHQKDFLNVLQQILSGEMAKSEQVCLPSTTHEKLLQVIEYLQAHLQEKVSLSTVAKEFGFSVRTLSRLFSSHLGITFSGYVKIARMIKALELIENGNTHVSHLAFQVGYESLSTFSNNFLQVFGNRPLYFINQRRR
jgi:AraC-like DNA-binding protein/mannose-6-phosphate isomerase-like protein (cupin superfamily)